MQELISRFATSFAALLTDTNTTVDVSGRIEDIRTAMLDALWAVEGAHAMSESQTWTAIERAREVQTLWYLRSDLFAEISAISGGEVAGLTVEKITEMFRGLVPQNQMGGRKRSRSF